MPTQMKHSGGIVDVILELGFDTVKYFEITANGTSQQISWSAPARRLTLHNASTTTPVYFNITGDDAVASASSTPGDNVKLNAGCIFEMDFDSFTGVAFITTGDNVLVEGYIGWKGSVGDC